MKKGVILLFVLLFSMPVVYSHTITLSDLFEKGRSLVNIPPEELFKNDPMSTEPDPSALPDSDGVTTHFYSNSKLIASKSDDGFIYNYQDRLGSETSGRQLPFGQELIDSENRFEFTGKELDESQLYYFGARYYDPSVGKFTSVDPVKENHAYGYVMNNPLTYIDPSGMEEWTPYIGIPSAAPAGVLPHTWPILPQEIEHPDYPDTLIEGGEITLGDPEHLTRAVWRAPTRGSPVAKYLMKISFCIDETHLPPLDPLEENQIYVKIKVAGVDAQERQGPWSEGSDPGVIQFPAPPQGMKYEVDPVFGYVSVVDDDVPDEPLDPNPNLAGFTSGNYPNPFSQATTFRYSIPENAKRVSDIEIFTSRGQRTGHSVPSIKFPGEHEVSFEAPSELSSGVYYARMNIDGLPYTQKFSLVR